jgi:hypothetical protein
MPNRSITSAALVEPLETRRMLSTQMHRPIEEFVAAQGTYDGGVFGAPPGTLFTPPSKNYIGWFSPAPDLLGISVDYAGLANNNPSGNLGLGTTFSGNVTEVRQRDGSSIVRVVLRTENALTYVIPFDPAAPPTQFGTSPLIFGERVPDVVAGATPALGNSLLTLTYASPQFGAPLVDILALVGDEPPPGTLLTIGFQATATGTFADGSPGMVTVTQRGIFNTNPNHPPGRDFFPVESIVLTHTGGRPGMFSESKLSSQSDEEHVADLVAAAAAE